MSSARRWISVLTAVDSRVIIIPATSELKPDPFWLKLSKRDLETTSWHYLKMNPQYVCIKQCITLIMRGVFHEISIIIIRNELTLWVCRRHVVRTVSIIRIRCGHIVHTVRKIRRQCSMFFFWPVWPAATIVYNVHACVCKIDDRVIGGNYGTYEIRTR